MCPLPATTNTRSPGVAYRWMFAYAVLGMPERRVDAVRDVLRRNAHAYLLARAVQRTAKGPLERRRERQHLNHVVRTEILGDGWHAVPL